MATKIRAQHNINNRNTKAHKTTVDSFSQKKSRRLTWYHIRARAYLNVLTRGDKTKTQGRSAGRRHFWINTISSQREDTRYLRILLSYDIKQVTCLIQATDIISSTINKWWYLQSITSWLTQHVVYRVFIKSSLAFNIGLHV